MVFFERHGMEEKEFFHYFTLSNYYFPLHFHRAYELILVNKGTLYVMVDQREYQLKEMDVAFIFSNQIHEFKGVENADITIILFSPELIGHFFTRYKDTIPNNNVLHLDEEINLVKLNSIYKQKSFLYKMCSDLIDQTTFKSVKQSTRTSVLHKILFYVDQHYFTDCTLKKAARDLGYDYQYLSKLFVQMTGMTFTDYLNNYRISQACYLLKNSQNSIDAVADSCGYNNLRTFHRNFKKITNQSPTQYRKPG